MPLDLRIGELLGAGGMGEVFAAEMVGAEGVAVKVAVKRLFATGSAEADAAFIQEARISAQLRHPNIVQLLQFDRDSEGRLCLVMELVEGVSLQSVMFEAWDALPLGLIINLMRELLSALDYAHTRTGEDGRPLGIVHRDVKPANILITASGHLKLADFGIALVRNRMTTPTGEGLVRGTLAYMSPEQAEGRPLDARSDLFSAGVVLWEMLAKRRLFNSGDAIATLNAIRTAPLSPPSVHAPEVPREYDEFVMKLLERDPQHRFQSAKEALEPLSLATALPSRSEALSRLVERSRSMRLSVEHSLKEEHHQPPSLALDPVLQDLEPPRSPAAPKPKDGDRPIMVLLWLTAAAMIGAVAYKASERSREPSREVFIVEDAPALHRPSFKQRRLITAELTLLEQMFADAGDKESLIKLSRYRELIKRRAKKTQAHGSEEKHSKQVREEPSSRRDGELWRKTVEESKKDAIVNPLPGN